MCSIQTNAVALSVYAFIPSCTPAGLASSINIDNSIMFLLTDPEVSEIQQVNDIFHHVDETKLIQNPSGLNDDNTLA